MIPAGTFAPTLFLGLFRTASLNTYSVHRTHGLECGDFSERPDGRLLAGLFRRGNDRPVDPLPYEDLFADRGFSRVG